MYLTNVAPLSRIPPSSSQILSYFISQKLEKGALVLVPLRKKKVNAIVFNQKNVRDLKIEIKKVEFQLKPILKILNKEPVISLKQIELARWISDYYFSPLGKTLSLFVSKRKSNLPIIEKGVSAENRLQKEIYLTPLGTLPKEVMQIIKGYISDTIKESKDILFLAPEKQKRKFWQEKLKDIKNDITIGTRSELFQYFPKLDLIILTEEENSNYKSEKEPRYNAKKLAEKMAELYNAKLILISSFPSIETYSLSQGKSFHISADFANMVKKRSSIEKIIIDMKSLKEWRPISPPLLKAIKENLFPQTKSTTFKTSKDISLSLIRKKTLLFINRRGESTTVLCQDCGFVKKCKNCEAPMVYHKKIKSQKSKVKNNNEMEMVCHHCGKKESVPEICEKCGSWRLITLGVGIEKIEKELKNNFPKAKIIRLDSETAPKESQQSKILKDFFSGDTDILVTTSLIFKYLPLPATNTVGIISIDAQLSSPDFRAGEEGARTINKLLSLMPRNFFIQTYFPEATAIKWIEEGEESFFKENLEERKKFLYPPFSELITLTSSDKNPTRAGKEAKNLKNKFLSLLRYPLSAIQILGPAPTFIPKIRGKYAWQILIKLKTKNEKLKIEILNAVPPNWVVDVDPIKTL